MPEIIVSPTPRKPAPRQVQVRGVRGLMDILAALRAMSPEQRESLGFATEADLDLLRDDLLAAFEVRTQFLEQRFAALERRVADLEARPTPPDLSDILNRLAAMEARGAAIQTRALVQETDFSLAEGDLDPGSWPSLAKAQKALTTLVRREHAARTTSRQRVLERVHELSQIVSRSEDEEFELVGHRARVQEFGDLDAALGRKLDEVAALGDLEAGQTYDVTAGWA